MGSPTGYALAGYGQMINCEPRMSAYAEAMRAVLTPGCRVIDIGAGPGVFSILACKLGAGFVIAIEPHDSIELLRQFAVDNGYSDKVEIFHGLSKDYRPSLKADVIISDIRGCLPLFEEHIQTIADARERLLAPNGRLIPKRDRLRVALVDSPETYQSLEAPWLRNELGIDLSAGNRFSMNQWQKVHLGPADLLSEAQDLMVLDYSVITDTDLMETCELVAERPGMAHGFIVWFDAELAPGIGFSNAPGQPEQIYGQAFFPFERAVELASGDRIEVKLRANLVNRSYIWSWDSHVWRHSAAKPEAAYRQSTFLGTILSPNKLASRSPRFVPPARRAHAIDRRCLSLLDGQRSLGEIAEVLAGEFPEALPSLAQALTHATELAARYPQIEFSPDPHEAEILLEDDIQ